MTLAGLLVFTTVYAVAVASPGPGVAAVVARVLGHGTGGIAGFIAGFFRSARAMRLVNRGAGAILAGAAAAIAAR